MTKLPSPSSQHQLRSTSPSEASLSTTSAYSHSDAGRDQDSGRWCEATVNRGVSWPRARPGQTVTVECPNNQAVKMATWKCGVKPVQWMNRPDLSHCTSPAVAGILDLVKENEERFTEQAMKLIAKELVDYTDEDEQVFGGDLMSVMTAMKEVTNQIDHHIENTSVEESNDIVLSLNKAILETSNNLLNLSRFETWDDIPSSVRPAVATTLLTTVEKSARQVASLIKRPTKHINVKSNLVVEVRVINISQHVEDQTFPANSHDTLTLDGSFITLTGKTVREFEVAGLSKMVFATYNNIERWLQSADDLQDADYENSFAELHRAAADVNLDYSSTNDSTREDNGWSNNGTQNLTDKAVNTRIISASFVNGNARHIKLHEPVVYMMKHILEEHVSHPSCAFWDYSKTDMRAEWSTTGCTLTYTNATHTRCACQHLTNFAVLMSIHNQQLSDVQKFSLSFITYFGCILSIICLAIAFLTFVSFKNLQCDQNTIHKNLVINLCIAEIIFVIGIVMYETRIFCAVVAAFLHYFFLVTFCWMCLEGIQLYIMLVVVFEPEDSRMKWYYLSGYGVPAIIVIISSIANPEGYGTPTHCWLSTEKGFIWAFVGPVCIILSVNFMMLGVALYVMCTHASNSANVWKARQKTTFENARSWIKGAFVLVVLLGLTWTFGLFYVNEQSIALAYLFTLFNSTQGVFIFVFHCLIDEKVQKEYKRWVRHRKWLPEDLRVKCGGVRSSASLTPNHTSSTGKMLPDQKLPFEYLSKLFKRNSDRKRSSTSTLPSSTSNNAKRNYNHLVQSSSSQQSSSRVMSSENESSQIYSEQQTEDPYPYMEPSQMAVGPEDEFYQVAGDFSIIEGSVADTDYLDNFCQRPASVINVDKYKIRNLNAANARLGVPVPPIRPIPECTLNGIPQRHNVNDKVITRESDSAKQPVSYTNLGAAGLDCPSPSYKIYPARNSMRPLIE